MTRATAATGRFSIARGILASAGIVNLPRLKTHSLTRMTGALKNTFGAVVGGEKAALHIRTPTRRASAG